MVWVAVRRATLLIPSGPAHDPHRKHLHIVLNDPFPDSTLAPKVLVVSVMSIPTSNIYDPSCTLFPGEHPFVVNHSFVAYKFAELQDPGNLQAKVDARQFVAKPLLSDKVFAHVITGLKESPYTEPRLLTYFQAATQSTAP
jgi:hypothetical protein